MDLQNSSSEVQSTVECRAAGSDEFPAAAQLRAEMARGMGSDFDALSKDWRAKFCAYFGGKQASGNAQLFLAYDGETPVGCAIVSLPDEYRRECFGIVHAHVNAVYVKPALRRQGIGRKLMELVLAWARKRGCSRVRLRTSDEGRLLYETLGFRNGREMELDLSAELH
jgi:GNAT superfamily N-acetyltransferase